MNIKTTLKTSVAAAALFAVAAPVAVSTPAEAGSVSNGNKNSVTLSGQVNRAVMYADDDDASEVFQVDNGASGSRFRIVFKGSVNESVSAGGKIEAAAFTSNDGSSVQIQDSVGLSGNTGDRGLGDGAFDERVVELYFDHKQFGRLTLGQGSVATDGMFYQDQSASWIVAEAGTDYGGAINYTVANVPNSRTASLPIIDGGRDDRIRYDSPSFGGFKLAVSGSSGGGFDIAGKYGGSFGGINVGATVGYTNDESIGGNEEWAASVSLGHSSGINGAFAYGHRDIVGASDADTWNVKLAYDAKLNSMGTTAFGISYGESDDFTTGDEETQLRFGVVQNVDSAGTNLYLGFSRHEIDNATTNFDDIWIAIAGARVKF